MHYMMTNHPKINATKYFALILQTVWTYILKVWQQGNADQTITTAKLPPNMWSEIQGIYATKGCLPPSTQDQIFTITKEELIIKPKQYIQSWITNSKNYICAELKILNQQHQLNTQDIWNFFPPQ